MNAIARITRMIAIAIVFTIVAASQPVTAGEKGPSQLVPDSDLYFLTHQSPRAETTTVEPDVLIGMIPEADYRFIATPFSPTPDLEDTRFTHIPDGLLFTKSDLDFIMGPTDGGTIDAHEWAVGVATPAAGQ